MSECEIKNAKIRPGRTRVKTNSNVKFKFDERNVPAPEGTGWLVVIKCGSKSSPSATSEARIIEKKNLTLFNNLSISFWAIANAFFILFFLLSS
jgi:hypothetical protein